MDSSDHETHTITALTTLTHTLFVVSRSNLAFVPLLLRLDAVRCCLHAHTGYNTTGRNGPEGSSHGESTDRLAYHLSSLFLLLANSESIPINTSHKKMVAHREDNGDADGETCAAWGGFLFQEGVCSSMDEATVIAEVILSELKEHADNDRRNNDMPSPSPSPPAASGTTQTTFLSLLEKSLEENLDLSSDEETKRLASILLGRGDLKTINNAEEQPGGGGDEENDEALSDVNNRNKSYPEEHGEEDDGIVLFDGECELCDRYIQLTKHHLIPKSTWPRMEPRFMHAAEALEQGDSEKAMLIMGPGLVYLLKDLEDATAADKSRQQHAIRQLLYRTCDICRPCHSAVHKTHENMELALSHSTIDLILEDTQIANFCKWASKQRVGRYAVKNIKGNHQR